MSHCVFSLAVLVFLYNTRRTMTLLCWADGSDGTARGGALRPDGVRARDVDPRAGHPQERGPLQPALLLQGAHTGGQHAVCVDSELGCLLCLVWWLTALSVSVSFCFSQCLSLYVSISARARVRA